MNTTPVIHSLNNSYCKQIVDVILPIQQLEFNVPITLEAQPDLLDIETNYHQTGGNFWGAVYNEQLVGTIALIGIGNNSAALRKMFVLKEYRGKELGIAQALVDNLIDYCRQNGITNIYLGTVDVMKAAHRFYEKNGFKRSEKHELPTSFPLMSADNVFYKLHLNN